MVVRMRRNRSETAKRRSHRAIAANSLLKCECGAERLPHRACKNCGRYRGRIVVDVVAREKKQARRAKRRAGEARAGGETSSKDTKEKEKETATA